MPKSKRNTRYGVKNLYIAPLIDEDLFTYEDPVRVPGVTKVSAEKELGDDPTYAEDETWTDDPVDNGFTGEIGVHDMENDPTMRKLFARITGYVVDSHGRIIGVSDEPAVPFAMMAEQEGRVAGKRRCVLKCMASKPNSSWETNEGSDRKREQLTIPYKATPVRLPNGTKASFYDDYPDTDTYETFFDKVDINLVTSADSGDAGNDSGDGE